MDVIEKMARAISDEGGFKSRTYPEKLAQAAYDAMMQHLAETGQVIVLADDVRVALPFIDWGLASSSTEGCVVERLKKAAGDQA